MYIQQVLLVSVLAVVKSQVLKSSTVLDSCPCDQVTLIREYECCCDTDPLEFQKIVPKQCLDKNFGSLFQIPMYDDIKQKTMSIDDLYNPFRLVYQIIKVLGSVMSRNSAQRTIDFSLSTPSDLKNYSKILPALLNKQQYEQLPSYIQPEQRLLNNFDQSVKDYTANLGTTAEYYNLYVKDKYTKKCIPYTATKYESVPYQSCVVKNTSDKIYTSYQNLAGKQCLVLNTDYLSTNLVSKACLTANNRNVGYIISNGVLAPIVYIQIDITTTTPTPNIINLFIGAKIFFDYDIQNVSGSTVTKKPKSGYQIGDPLIFYNSQQVVKGIVLNDIYKPNGSCITDNTVDTHKYNLFNPLDVQFGKNFTLQCSGGAISTSFYLNDVTYIGVFPVANPISNSDWINILGTKVSSPSQSLVLMIFYQKQGKLTNPTFRITQATRATLSQNEQKQNSISVLFYEEEQSVNYYLSKPPQINQKLNRNVLYPFFTFNE